MHRHLRLVRPLALSAALIATTALAAAAQTGAAGSPGEWLTQYSSARTLGLGGAFVASADDALGAIWNPAGLPLLDQNQVRFETALLYENTSINGVSLAVPGSRWPSFGVSVLSLGSSDFQRTDALNNPLGTFSEGETAYLLTLAKSVTSRVSLGANLKLVQQTVESFNGGGFGVDLGGIVSLTPTLRVGLSAANLGGPSITLRDVAETWPGLVRAGAALEVLDGRALLCGEIDQSQGLGTRLRAGTEYRVFQGFTMRVGYDDTRATGGMSYQISPRYDVDYGVADNPLGMTHRVGISYSFGGYYASSHADPDVFSPTGEHAVTRISLNARTKGAPERWTLEIVDKSDRVVRRFGGEGAPSPHIEWDGKDETGLPLADGAYRYHLEVRDHQGRILESTVRSLEISTSGPQGSVPVIPVQP
jgi:hypothetical protein